MTDDIDTDKDKFKPVDHWVWDTDNAVFRDETDCTKTGVPAAYTEDGHRLQGFGNPYYREKYQNKDGRPKGRDTTKLEAAQDSLDAFAGIGVQRLRWMAENKYEKLGMTEPVPVSLQMKVITYLLDKSIAAEKEKVKYEAKSKKESTKDQVVDEDFTIGDNVVAFEPQ